MSLIKRTLIFSKNLLRDGFKVVNHLNFISDRSASKTVQHQSWHCDIDPASLHKRKAVHPLIAICAFTGFSIDVSISPLASKVKKWKRLDIDAGEILLMAPTNVHRGLAPTNLAYRQHAVIWVEKEDLGTTFVNLK